MSKKRKAVPAGQPTRPVATVPSSPSTAPTPRATAPAPAPQPGLPVEPDHAFELIRFDRRVKWLIGLVVGLFVLLTLAKIHNSSIPYWNQVMPDGSDPKRGLVAGTPRAIRMDEWAAMVPFELSQINNGFPLENPAIGGEKPGLVVYLPVKHFVMLFRPNFWGLFFLDAERGFAWNGSFYPLFSFLVLSLLFLILTRNQFWLSVLGSFWLILSPGIAWWSFSPLTHVFSGSLILIASFSIFYAQRPRTLLWAGALFVWSVLTFALNLYPPYQVPFGYLLILLLIGFLWRHYRKDVLFRHVGAKVATLALAGVAIAAIAYLYYLDAKPTIDAMSNTVYPGKRSETGGSGFIANWLSEYYSGWFITDQKLPGTWLNVCELSHAVTFMPVIGVSLAVYSFYKKTFDPLLVLVLAYSILLLLWIEVGFPEFLAKITLLNICPPRRVQVPLGIVNVTLAVLYLAYIRDKVVTVPKALKIGLIVLVVGFMVTAALVNLRDAMGFYKGYQLVLPTLFFLALNLLLLPVFSVRHKGVWVGALMALFTLPNLGINPVSKGLSPITEHALYQKVRELHQQDPKARWTVMGSQYITYLVTATGVNQLSGIKFMPDYKTMRVLDPTAKRDSAYNRYAHTVYASFIDGRDSTIIVNQFEDGYTVGVDPCSPKLQKLNAKYFLFEKTPQPVEVRCMTPVATLGSISIYKRTDF